MNLRPDHIALLVTVRRLCEEYGHSPSLHEIARESGLKHRTSVSRRAKVLREAGLLDWRPDAGRTMRLTAAGIAALDAPDGAWSYAHTEARAALAAHLREKHGGQS